MRQARACALSPARVMPVPEARLARPLALAGGPPAVPVLLVRAANPVRAGVSARPVATAPAASAAEGRTLTQERPAHDIALPWKEEE